MQTVSRWRRHLSRSHFPHSEWWWTVASISADTVAYLLRIFASDFNQPKAWISSSRFSVFWLVCKVKHSFANIIGDKDASWTSLTTQQTLPIALLLNIRCLSTHLRNCLTHRSAQRRSPTTSPQRNVKLDSYSLPLHIEALASFHLMLAALFSFVIQNAFFERDVTDVSIRIYLRNDNFDLKPTLVRGVVFAAGPCCLE